MTGDKQAPPRADAAGRPEAHRPDEAVKEEPVASPEGKAPDDGLPPVIDMTGKSGRAFIFGMPIEK